MQSIVFRPVSHISGPDKMMQTSVIVSKKKKWTPNLPNLTTNPNPVLSRSVQWLCRAGYATVIHLRCIDSHAEGRFKLAPPQPSEEVIDLIIKAVKYADVTTQAREMNVRTCISEKRR